MAAKIATLVLVLSALLLGLSVSGGWDAVTMLVTVVGSLAAGLLYGRAWGWKGLAMSIAIAIIYSAAAFTGVILWLRSRPPTGNLIAGIAGVGVIIIGGISLILALIGGIIGAILHRRRRTQQ
jgi:CHASE2 domain-containing sensor protein